MKSNSNSNSTSNIKSNIKTKLNNNSVFNINTFFNTPKNKVSKNKDTQKYNSKININKELINSYYTLTNPIIIYLIKYNDSESKRLI